MSNFNAAFSHMRAIFDASHYVKYNYFTPDAARLILLVSKWHGITPELLAVTWMNESVFSFYPQPNNNGTPDDFSKWDVGPMQMNVKWTLADIDVKYYAVPADLNLREALGTHHNIHFNGNPTANVRLAAIKLKRLHKTDDAQRAIMYTGPNARPYRLESFNKYAPLFRTFFERFNPYEV